MLHFMHQLPKHVKKNSINKAEFKFIIYHTEQYQHATQFYCTWLMAEHAIIIT